MESIENEEREEEEEREIQKLDSKFTNFDKEVQEKEAAEANRIRNERKKRLEDEMKRFEEEKEKFENDFEEMKTEVIQIVRTQNSVDLKSMVTEGYGLRLRYRMSAYLRIAMSGFMNQQFRHKIFQEVGRLDSSKTSFDTLEGEREQQRLKMLKQAWVR